MTRLRLALRVMFATTPYSTTLRSTVEPDFLMSQVRTRLRHYLLKCSFGDREGKWWAM